MKKYWEWIKNNVIGILVGIASILGAVVFWLLQKKRIGELEDTIEVKEAKVKLAHLEGIRSELNKDADNNKKEIEEIDKQLLENKRKIIESHTTESLSEDEMLKKFKDLGY